MLRFDHIHLFSPDPAAAAKFYVDVLGATETGRFGEPVVNRVTLHLAGLDIFIGTAEAEHGPAPVGKHQGLEHFAFIVDDLDAAVAALAAKGAVFCDPILTPRPGVAYTFIEGPDHVRIEVLQRK
jgi:catechol 2,3-dioxygenase-like lactoylglutathione lyase family enzyme